MGGRVSPADMCWCGLSRALHEQGAPETRDHRYVRAVELDLSRTCPGCGCKAITGGRCSKCGTRKEVA
jgi:hypothetical protein